MSKIKNIVGNKYSKLTVICDDGTREIKSRAVKWKCLCDCGNIVYAEKSRLENKKIRSCGCLRFGLTTYTKHNHTKNKTKSTTYQTWLGMKQRCLNPNANGYKYYGLRGIKVCNEWQESFEIFLLDMGEKPKGFSIDRIDVNKSYNKENCRWADSKTQSINKRNVKKFEHDGLLLTIPEWAKKSGISYNKLRSRIYHNWSIERALS
jgi:hypothetical protein